MNLTFPNYLDVIKEGVLAQHDLLVTAAEYYADAIQAGGLVHVYANGHSRTALEETVVRMGALAGFHPLATSGLITFTDVVGKNGLRINQHLERQEGITPMMLEEYTIGPKDVLVVITATGTTVAAVDIALAFCSRYPDNPIVAYSSQEQSKNGPRRHSSGKNVWHVVNGAKKGVFLDNCMPMGDVSVHLDGKTGTYDICPVSTLGAVTLVQSLNELTLRILDERGYTHRVVQNMHLADTQDSLDRWIRDNRERYSRTLTP